MVGVILKKNIKIKYILVITIILISVVASNYFFTYKDISALIATKNSIDSNPEIINQILNSFNGLTYILRFLLSADSIVIFTLIFSIFSVSIFGYDLISDILSGRGNFIVSRIKYKEYVKSTLIAQVIFNYVYLIIFFLALFIFSYLILGNLNINNGVFTGYLMKLTSSNILVYLVVVLTKSIYLASIISLITLASSMIYIFIKNKYIVQLFPLIYYFSTLFLVNAISNIIPTFTLFLSSFIIDAQIFNIMEYGIVSGDLKILPISIFIIVIGIIDVALYKINIKKFGKDYII